MRDHYVKLDNVLNRRKQKEVQKEEEKTAITRIVERTVNENQRIIKEQQAEIKKAKSKA